MHLGCRLPYLNQIVGRSAGKSILRQNCLINEEIFLTSVGPNDIIILRYNDIIWDQKRGAVY